MNRRHFVKCGVGGLMSFSLTDWLLAEPKPDTWFSRKQLLWLFKQLDGQTTREAVDMTILRNWNGKPLESYEAVYLAMMRMCNIMHRKTLDNQSKHWLVISPEMTRYENWCPYVFGKYSTPGKMGGKWILQSWRHCIKEEVSKGVYTIGCMNGKWQFYICEGFPDNKIMLGMGYKEVVHHRKDGIKKCDWKGYPEFIPNYVAYMGKPTRKNYAVITLKGSK